MFNSLTKGTRRTGMIAAASIAGAIGFLAVPGFVSAAPPTVPPVIVNPTVPPTPPTVPPIIVNPTLPEPTAPDDFAQPTFPENTAPDDLVQPEFPETGDPETDPANPANPADPANPVDPANPAAPAAPAPQAAPTGQLPETGVDSTLFVILGVALTLGGSAIVTVARRKADTAAS